MQRKTMKIENWILVGENQHDEETFINPNEFLPGKFSIIGNVYGNDKFIDGFCVKTSPITKLSSTSATTLSGSIYELGEMDHAFKKFLEASEKGIPILENWRIDEGLFWGSIRGSEKDNKFGCRKYLHGTLSKENERYLLHTPTGDIKEVFINWFNMNSCFKFDIKFTWTQECINALLKFGHLQCQLDLTNEDHKKLLK